jgi:hypothetical protein
MAFLDNSGDIILDAVLTDTGRKRMADGNFKITNFGLGDDDINYSQYNKNHASGSAYYDLEILQTPVLQAFTQTNANINYGLLNITNTNILYMPSLVINSKQTEQQTIKNGIYYIGVNASTVNQLKTNNSFTDQQVQDASTATTPALYVEGGINSSDLAKTLSNQQGYISSVGLSNTSYTLDIDNRIFTSVMAPANGGAFSINSDGSNFQLPTALRDMAGASISSNLQNYSTYRIGSKANAVFQTDSGTAVTNYSVITGPGDTITFFKLNVFDNLKSTVTRDNLYDKLGSVNQNLFGTGDLFDYIDTMVYLTGTATGASIGIPVRIIRYAS